MCLTRQKECQEQNNNHRMPAREKEKKKKKSAFVVAVEVEEAEEDRSYIEGEFCTNLEAKEDPRDKDTTPRLRTNRRSPYTIYMLAISRADVAIISGERK